MGGIQSENCNNMAQQIWLWCIEGELWLSACHIPGSIDVVADSESRVFHTSTEWSLHPDVFDHINEMWGPFEIDLFASRLNFKIPTYVSWKPDPNAKYVNALFKQWKEHYFLCFSTFQPDSNLSAKNRTGSSYWCNLSPFLADTTLVYNAPSPFNRQPSVAASAGLSLDTTSQQCSTPPSQAAKVDSLQGLGKSLQLRNISEKAATIILQSWSDGMQKRYKLYIKQWIDFCCERQADPYNPPLTSVLDFLVSLHEKGLSYTTINTARSAISAISLSEDQNTIGCHPLVSRFMKGIYKGSPPVPRYNLTWDVQPVLNYLASKSPVDGLDLKMLTHKLIMLIALVSAQRGQSLHILDNGPGCMKDLPDGYEFLLTAHIKQQARLQSTYSCFESIPS